MPFLQNLKNAFGLSPTKPPTAPPDDAKSVALAEPKPTPATSARPAAPGLPPAEQKRTELIRFVAEALRSYQNEPGTAPKSLKLCVLAETPADETLCQVAVWSSEPGKFQRELNRQLVNQYIQLPKNWTLMINFFRDELPATCTVRQGKMGLLLPAMKADLPTALLSVQQLARLETLAGQTEQPVYQLDPAEKNQYCIGRGQTAQTPSGRIRTNDIVFLADDDPALDPEQADTNGAVSRFHATIRYQTDRQRYVLMADTGGLPASGNKTKILHTDDTVTRADIADMAYPLRPGDQIELGGTAKLLFDLL